MYTSVIDYKSSEFMWLDLIYEALLLGVQNTFLSLSESYLKQWKKKADWSLSLVSKSLPIVYFPFLKSCHSAGKNPILCFRKHRLSQRKTKIRERITEFLSAIICVHPRFIRDLKLYVSVSSVVKHIIRTGSVLSPVHGTSL